MKIQLLVCACLALVSGLEALRKPELLNLEKIPRTAADKYESRWAKLTGPMELKNVGDIWKDCSQSGDPLKIDSVVITPDPPKKGATISINATVTLSEDVSAGQISIELKWGIIRVVNENLNLCDEVKSIGQTCPLAKGDHTLGVSAAIPGIAPGGHYTGTVKVTDQNGKELVCVDLDFHM